MGPRRTGVKRTMTPTLRHVAAAAAAAAAAATETAATTSATALTRQGSGASVDKRAAFAAG